ncbi:MAG TPA: ABC transporter ATP-binding protein [Dehalococcoidia bacterium]|nr:ABC transporter ATP-binding protein [Dehalococcoidia bacterium]
MKLPLQSSMAAGWARRRGQPPALSCQRLTVAYGKEIVLKDLDLGVEAGEMVSVIGPNGSGKSTLLRAMARILKPRGGAVYLDGKAIASLPTGEVARRLAILPQAPEAPGEMTVEELVWLGRHPHIPFLGLAGARDREAVAGAVEQADLRELAHRPIQSLSGGERQRAWLAMALAQEPQVLLLDEPTTFLDLRHQVESLELLRRLNESQGITIVMALQDINQAAHFSHRIVVMKEGEVYSAGLPRTVLTADMLREVFQVEAEVVAGADGGAPVFIIVRSLRGEIAAQVQMPSP